MKNRIGRARFAVVFLVVATATLSAACATPTSDGGAPWLAAGCYGAPSATDIQYSGELGVTGNALLYAVPGDGQCNNTPTPNTATIVRGGSQADANIECDKLGRLGTDHAYQLSPVGYQVPDDAWLCPVPG
jgi:hypothetical protein